MNKKTSNANVFRLFPMFNTRREQPTILLDFSKLDEKSQELEDNINKLIKHLE